MSGVNISEKSEKEALHSAGDHNPDSFSSDSGVSSCGGKEDSSTGSSLGSGGHKESPAQAPSADKHKSHSHKDKEGKERRHSSSNSRHTFPRGGVGGFGGSGFGLGDRDYSDFFEDDPFFADRARSFGRRFADKPRLSERLWGKKNHSNSHSHKGGSGIGGRSSIFDNDNFVNDLRKKIAEEKKMFFDGGSDPFASAFGGSARSSSPVGGSAGGAGAGGRAGFPFEDLRTGARARFDEFANRHPMFSTMRNQPAWNLDDHFGHHHGFDNFPRERNNSGSSGGGSGASTASTGEERVIPIQIIRDDPPKSQQQPQQARGKSPAPPQVDVTPRVIREKSPQPPQQQQYQQQQQPPTGPQRCNTEPNHTILVDDNRAARAQSAPPVSQNGTTAPRVETTDSKPQTTQFGGNSSKTPKPEKQIPTANNGTRSIPIIIEGRKGPTVHSAPNGSCNSSNQSPPQPKVSRPAERSPTPPPKKQTVPRDPLTQVSAVLDEVKELEKQVDEYKGNSREERDYLIIDEMLTRCLIKLDVVETEGRDDVRTARKDCIKYIQGCISKLEKKAPLPPQPEENNEMETGETDKMETGSQPQTTTDSKDGKPQSSNDTSKIENSDDKMDVDPSSNGSANSGANGETVAQPSNGGGSGDREMGNANADQQTVNA